MSFDDDLTKMVNITNEAKSSRTGLFLKSLNRNALNKNANKDIWCLSFENMWLDFVHTKTVNNETKSLIENTSFKVWFVNVYDFYKSISNTTAQKDIEELTNNEYLEKAYERLSKVIPIDPLIKSDLRKSLIKPKRSNSASGSSALMRNQQHSNYMCRNIYSKLNIIGEINSLHVQCNHSQLVFLLRLIDTVDLLSQQLKTDTDQIFQYKIQRHENIQKDSRKTLNSFKTFDFSTDNNFEDNENSSKVNVSIIVNHAEVDLVVNDLRKEPTTSKSNHNDGMALLIYLSY